MKYLGMKSGHIEGQTKQTVLLRPLFNKSYGGHNSRNDNTLCRMSVKHINVTYVNQEPTQIHPHPQ